MTDKAVKPAKEVKEIFVETKKDILEIVSNHPDMKWYIVQTAANSEEAAKRNIMEQIKLRQKENQIGTILIPAVKAIENKASGGKKIVKKKLYTGYLFVFATMDSEIANLIRNASKVSRFVLQDPATLMPVVVPKREIDQVISSLKDDTDSISHKKEYGVGTGMRVKTGPFKDFSGTILSVNYDKSTIKLSINVFNRESEVDIAMDDLEKEL